MYKRIKSACKFILIPSVLLLNVNNANAQQEKTPPNILFLLVDDMGYTDISIYGSKFHETPHVDALASRGMKFTNTYTAASICSPTRASIMTGKYPVRTGVTDWIPGQKVTNTQLIQPKTKLFLDSTELSFAEVLRKSGYATYYAGKWHLGEKEGLNPLSRGFEEYYSAKEMRVAKNKLTTDSITVSAANFISRKAREKKPFMAFISYYDVHTPIYEHPDFIAHYKSKLTDKSFKTPSPLITEHQGVTRTRQDDPAYASMVSAIDRSVGTLSKLLNQLGIAENTVVIFTSDNGGLSTGKNGGPTANLPLRAGKGWLYEGGIRVPLIVSYPGKVKAGSSSSAPTMSTDFYPTFLDLAGLKPLPEQAKDGLSLVPVLTEKGSTASRDFFWHYPHYHGTTWAPGAAIRSGDWKLIAFYELQTFELYNLKEDPYEKQDISASNPEKVKALKAKLASWQRETNAQMPSPNPKYDPNVKSVQKNDDGES